MSSMKGNNIKEFIRDGRAPIPRNETISRVMSAIGAKNTKPEVALRKALWGRGMIGYRLHKKNIPGRPDIVYSKNKLAVFVNGSISTKTISATENNAKTNVISTGIFNLNTNDTIQAFVSNIDTTSDTLVTTAVVNIINGF